MPGSFYDTNILIHFVSADVGKSERARALLRAGGTISVQVLNEVASVARSKLAMSWPQVREVLFVFRGLLSVRPLTLTIQAHGIALAERHRLHVYDAMIVASALEAGCDILYTEDLHHGLRIDDRLTIVNPFA